MHLEMDEVVKWQGSTVEVEAPLIRRLLWTTTSINVILDGKPILRTGGQLKFVGSQSAVFTHSGLEHTAKLNWGMSGLCSFPYQLRIDEVLVSTARVHIRNWPIAGIPLVVMAGLVLGISHVLHHL